MCKTPLLVSFACPPLNWVLSYCTSPSHYLQSNLCYAATQEKQKKWLLKAGGCLAEENISTKLKFGKILYGCFRQVGCLIKVTANSGLTIYTLYSIVHNVIADVNVKLVTEFRPLCIQQILSLLYRVHHFIISCSICPVCRLLFNK